MELIFKIYLSSDCSLQFENMKLESLVIVNQNVTVNTFPGLVLTARHTMGVDFTRNRDVKLTTAYGGISDWGEVVTR